MYIVSYQWSSIKCIIFGMKAAISVVSLWTTDSCFSYIYDAYHYQNQLFDLKRNIICLNFGSHTLTPCDSAPLGHGHHFNSRRSHTCTKQLIHQSSKIIVFTLKHVRHLRCFESFFLYMCKNKSIHCVRLHAYAFNNNKYIIMIIYRF